MKLAMRLPGEPPKMPFKDSKGRRCWYDLLWIAR